jgi:hypothetical protein
VVHVVDQLSLPAIEIKGIGDKSAGDLAGAGIYTVGDLLRVTILQVHDAVSAHASVRDARSWCQMAGFMQVNDMSAEWAEALQRAGLAGVPDLRYRQLPHLREIFVTARSEGRLTVEPTDAQLFEIVKDSMVIANTGALNGTVMQEEGAPIPDAAVQIGKQNAVADARGRFRVMRIPLWARSTAFISHPEYRSGRFPLNRVQPSTATNVQSFQLRVLPQGVPAEPEVLMEVRGDRLPPVGDSQISSREVQRADLLERDILTVVERSADGERVKLVSKLLICEDGRFLVPFCWFPVSDVATSEPGSCFVVRPERLEPISITPLRLGRWIGMLRALRQVGPRPTDPEQLDPWLSDVSDSLRALGMGRRF